MTIIYIVISQEEYDHSYSEHTIHCITSNEHRAYDFFKSLSTSGLDGKLLLKADSNDEWLQPFTLFNGIHNHPYIKVIDKWSAIEY